MTNLNRTDASSLFEILIAFKIYVIVKNKRIGRILVENKSNIFNCSFNIFDIFIIIARERDDLKKNKQKNSIYETIK